MLKLFVPFLRWFIYLKYIYLMFICFLFFLEQSRLIWIMLKVCKVQKVKFKAGSPGNLLYNCCVAIRVFIIKSNALINQFSESSLVWIVSSLQHKFVQSRAAVRNCFVLPTLHVRRVQCLTLALRWYVLKVDRERDSQKSHLQHCLRGVWVTNQVL